MSTFPTPGSIYELFGFPISELVLMDYDVGQNIKSLSSGQFSINLFMHITYPILVIFCSIVGFEWPIAKDMVVIRIAQRTFAIAFPGLLYGLKFPKYCPEALFDRLTRVFEHFSDYKDINENNQGYPMVDDEPDMLNRLRPQIEHVAHEALKKLGHFPGISRFRLPNASTHAIKLIEAELMLL
ncbi:hypothetical protein SESBI_34450 [Sesbania bispinosa]|nr:hypothetical protein SESBI_34450 [Sesbania bispinosa]